MESLYKIFSNIKFRYFKLCYLCFFQIITSFLGFLTGIFYKVSPKNYNINSLLFFIKFLSGGKIHIVFSIFFHNCLFLILHFLFSTISFGISSVFSLFIVFYIFGFILINYFILDFNFLVFLFLENFALVFAIYRSSLLYKNFKIARKVFVKEAFFTLFVSMFLLLISSCLEYNVLMQVKN